MKKLGALKLLMSQNGMRGAAGGWAASLEILPLGLDLFDPYGSLSQDRPGVPPVAEGGSCTTCASTCQNCTSCGSGCVTTCYITCKSSAAG